MPKILVFNPNSSRAMTCAIDDSLVELRQGHDIDIICETNQLGPPGIESDEHVAAVSHHVLAAATASDADIFIASCFSDPGVAITRARLATPILGIAESAFRAALATAPDFGIFSIVQPSIQRHARQLKALGLEDFCRADRSLDLSVAASGDASTFERLVEVGTQLRDEDRAQSLILGCAGLGVHRAALQDRLGIPVFDPVQAAVAEAISLILSPPSA